MMCPLYIIEVLPHTKYYDYDGKEIYKMNYSSDIPGTIKPYWDRKIVPLDLYIDEKENEILQLSIKKNINLHIVETLAYLAYKNEK